MAEITQQPAELDLVGVAGSPFVLTVDISAVDASDDPIPWVDFSAWAVVINGPTSPGPTQAIPTLANPSTGVLTVSWTGAQTQVLLNGSYTWALEIDVESAGPYSLIAGNLRMGASTTPGASTSATVDLSVLVGTATASVAVTLGGPVTGGGGGAVDSVFGRTGVVVAATGDYTAPEVGAPNVFNVMAYGATGNGSTDDTTAITTANVAAAAGNGGVLYFPAGTYVTQPQTHYSNVTWVGESRASTVVQLKAGSNTDLLTSNGFASVVGTGSTGTTGCGLKSITLDANKTNQTALARNWVHAGENYVIDDVWFINGYGGGIYTYYAGSDNVVEGMATKFKVYNYGAEWGCIGWEMHGPHDTQISNGTISTLDSTIKNMNSGLAYGATPISGGVALPAVGTTFTFQCTSSDTAHFPTTGGVFLLPLASTNSNPPTWTLVTYTSATTPGGNQLFAGCTALQTGNCVPSVSLALPTYGILDTTWAQNAIPTSTNGTTTLTFAGLTFGSAVGSVPSNGVINGVINTSLTVTGPGITGSATITNITSNTITLSGTISTLTTGAYTFSAGSGGGVQLDTVHVWGRHHIGWYTNQPEWTANCEVEGAFVANVVLDSVACVWMGGSIYGTNSQSGQAFEVGLQVGQNNNVTRCLVATLIYNVGYAPINMGKTAGDNKITMVGNNSTAGVTLKNPFQGGDWYEIDEKSNHAHSVYSVPTEAQLTAGSNGPFVAVSGVGAAITATRYVGGVSGSSPATGTFLTGDWAMDPTTPTVWICTAGGTPGTWAQVTVAGAPPTGAAGGVLTGTYPNPSGIASSVSLPGSPTTTTQAALTNNTDIATTAYTDSAVGVETTRAEAAEALALAKANNLSDVASAGVSRFNLHNPIQGAVQAVAVANVNIASAPASIDGYSFTTSGTDTLLLTGQSTGSQNGVWRWNGAGSALTRATDFPSAGSVTTGRIVQVQQGTVYANSLWALDVPSNAPITIDTTSQTWNVIDQAAANIPLSSFGAATAPVPMGNENFTSLLPAITSGQAPTVGQLAGSQTAYVVSGCVWTADSAGANTHASMTSGTVMIRGILLTVAAVTARSFTASNDTYVDLQDNGDGTASINYSSVTNNSLSPALHNSGTLYNTCRIAIITVGASNIAAAGNIGQGTTNYVLTGAALGSSTVASGSNTHTIGTTPLNVAAGSSFSTGGGWVQVATTTETDTIQFTGVSTNTLTGVTLLSGTSANTVATGQTVTQVFPVGVTDLLGNPIYPTTPYPTLVGSVNFANTFTTTTTTTPVPVPGLIAPFVVPGTLQRNIKVILTSPFFGSSATAGTTVQATLKIGNATAGTGVVNAQMKSSVASDGPNLVLEGVLTLAAGSYTAQCSVQQTAAGTITMSASYGVTQLYVELV